MEEIDCILDQKQRNILAKRFGLLSIDDFVFRAELSNGNLCQSLKLKGKVFAKIVQTCVLSLDEIVTSIEKEFELVLVLEELDLSDVLDGPDFEYYSGQSSDIGELMAVELALSIDPYPRKIGKNIFEEVSNMKGVNFSNEEELQADICRNVKNPFLILDKLKRN